MERICKFIKKCGKVKIEFFPREKNTIFEGENRVFGFVKIFLASQVF